MCCGEVAFSLERGSAIGGPVMSSRDPIFDVTADIDVARREIAQNRAVVGNVEDHHVRTGPDEVGYHKPTDVRPSAGHQDLAAGSGGGAGGAFLSAGEPAPQMIDSALAGEPFAVDHDGRDADDFIYSTEVATGIVGAVLCPNILFQQGLRDIHLGSERVRRLFGIADAVRRDLPTLTSSLAPVETPETTPCSIAAARAETGCAPDRTAVTSSLKSLGAALLHPAKVIN
jgi:hypothetical protein